MTIIEKFQNEILDNTNNSIEFFFTKTNNLYVIHIYNPNLEKIKISNENKDFYKKVITMLFNKNKTGCFNHEYPDNHIMNDYDFEQLFEHFFLTKYIVILINNNCNPLSYLTIDDINNTIWTVCTNKLYRKRGYMTILLAHCLKLIKLNKLIINVTINELKMYIRKINPLAKKLLHYYGSFNFNHYQENSEFIILKYNK